MPNFCDKCGNPIGPDWKWCKYCGKGISVRQEPITNKTIKSHAAEWTYFIMFIILTAIISFAFYHVFSYESDQFQRIIGALVIGIIISFIIIILAYVFVKINGY